MSASSRDDVIAQIKSMSPEQRLTDLLSVVNAQAIAEMEDGPLSAMHRQRYATALSARIADIRAAALSAVPLAQRSTSLAGTDPP